MTAKIPELAFASIRQLGLMLRKGETTPTELAEFFLTRLETVGRHLNAVVTITAEKALRDAKLAEEELATGHDRGPLHGIPYGAKDILATSGITTTWGAAPLRDQMLSQDAAVIERLHNAGAILIAKLATVELAGGFGYNQADATFTGPGINPWNVEAWSGGSSSGSGSAVGAGVVPFAIGSETGSSILTPSMNCGISGMRPSYGRVSRRGAMALCWTLDKLGPLCRTADDCGLVLEAISGPDPLERSTMDAQFLYRPDRDRASGFRVGVLREGLEGSQPEVRDAFERSLGVLSGLAALEDVTLPDYPYRAVSEIIIQAEGTAALENLILSGQVHELTAPEDRIGSYAGYAISSVDYLRAMRIRRQMMTDLDDLFAQYDCVVHPSYRMVASPLNMTFDEYRGEVRWSFLVAASNLAGMPAMTIPNGFGERGLPTGLMLVGRAGEDSSVIAVARAYQDQTTWHTRHPDW